MMNIGRRAVVTGGSSGIGKAIAKELLATGATVVLVARNPERLARACDDLAAMEGVPAQRVRWLAADVAEPGIEGRLAQAEDLAGGPIDLLVMSHGFSHPAYFRATERAVLEELLRTNLIGVWQAIQAYLPQLTASRGRIVAVASYAGFLASLGYSAYGASKFAVFGLAEALRNELAPDGIRVHILCPPDTDTPSYVAEQRIKPYETREMSRAVPLLTAEAVARAMMRGVRRGRFVIAPGFMTWFSYRLKGIWPGLAYRLVDRALSRARRSER